MGISVSSVTLPGVLVTGSNPLPIFRDPVKDKVSRSDGSLTDEEQMNLGYETGYRVLPYRLYDKYDRQKKPIQLKTIVLENDFLRVEFLPEQGGRLFSMIDKTNQKEVFLRNPVYQPCNLGILDAWFSGGVEWNVSQYGHTFTSNLPVHFALVKDGEYEFLRMFDYERCKKLFYQIDFHLPKKSKVLYAHIRLINDENEKKSTYWWTNAALPERNKVRVFSGTADVIFIRPESIGNNVNPERVFGHAKLPVIPTMPDTDSTYPENSNYSNEFFFQNKKTDKSPWSAAAYDDGTLYFDRSTQPLRIRKMFCWGSHRGGRNWCEYLSVPGEESRYIELQAGLAPTQLNGIDLPPNTEWTFTQAFGSTVIDKLDAPFHPDWQQAKDYVVSAVNKELSESTILDNHDLFDKMAKLPIAMSLSNGSGWGALEAIRREQAGISIPMGLSFPMSSIGYEQLPWLYLLQNQSMPPQSPLDTPASWMVDKNWQSILEASVGPESNYVKHLHLGVMKYENFDFADGIAEWEKSLSIERNPWALRNLAVASLRMGNSDKALELMEQVIKLEDNKIDAAFTEEYFELLIKSKQYSKLWDVYRVLPEGRKNKDRIVILAAYAAVELDHFEFIESLIDREFACIREGDNMLVDIWYRYTAKKEAIEKGFPFTEAFYKEIRAKRTPPKNFDFRMLNA